MIDKLLTLATDSVAAAMTAGADAAEAMIADGFGRHVEIRDGNIENLEQAEGSEIGLRVFVGKSSAMKLFASAVTLCIFQFAAMIGLRFIFDLLRGYLMGCEKISMPGSVLPSRNSKQAPPPVET